MRTLLEYIVQGISLGAVYGLLAMPLSLVFSATGRVDLGVGGYAVVAGMAAAAIGLPAGVLVGVLAGVLCGGAMGVLYLALERRGVEDPISVALIGLAILFATQSFAQWRFGVDPAHLAAFSTTWRVEGVAVPSTGALNAAVGLGLLSVLVWALYRTSLGRSMRATAISPRDAQLIGVGVRSIQVGAFLLSGALAGLAGVLLVGSQGLSFVDGLPLTIAGFGGLIILGLGGPGRAFAGGLLLGLVEVLSNGYAPSGVATVIPLLFILAILASGRLTFEAREVRP